MSTHKYFDRICCVVLAVTLALTVLFVNAEQLGVQKASSVMGYEQKLFDTSKVHTIDILMDDWDSFLADCESEEYSNCTVVIDNDAYKNVAIRAKGNTSLTQVASYGNNRYSFKIEFDHYDSSKTYYGLDKLCLNNIIQDNTYMKDYLTYQMMAAMGVASPLCSYVYITVNGEDWGLYLAVEGIEEAFLQRNYGKNYGTLYKPDSMNMGGGRGNGEKFSMDDFLENFDFNFDGSTASGPQMNGADDPASINSDPSRLSEDPSSEPSTEADSEVSSHADIEADSKVSPNADMEADSEISSHADRNMDSEMTSDADRNVDSEVSSDADVEADSEMISDADRKADSEMTSDADRKADSETAADTSAANPATTENPNGAAPEQPFGNHSGFQPGQMPSGEGKNMPQMPGSNNGDIPQMPDSNDGNMPQMPDSDNNTVSQTTDDQNGTMPQLPDGDGNMPQMPGSNNGDIPQMPDSNDGNMPQMPDSNNGDIPQMPDSNDGNMPQMPDGGGRGMMNSSDDVLLKYIDDNPESYSNIWDNAKTDLSDSDKTRLIAALKQLSEGEDLENTVDITAVISYFVVHNFVLNFDSYTGSMIHNYYLYEKDGQMQMIPWDYNLAFGGFESAGSASNLVNYPIDSPVSGGTVSDRPMIAWIFESQEYTDLYHQIFASFLADYFDNGYFEEMIDALTELISPYVEKDPTKFCTLEEFETGVSTLKEFCLLRAESIQGQLDGTIGSTSDTQNTSDLIDASHLIISDMGSMNNSMGGGMGVPGDFDFSEKKSFLQNFMNTQKEDQEESDTTEEFGQEDHSKFGSPPDASGNPMESAAPSVEALIELALCGLVLLIGLLTAGFYRRRR